MFRETSNQASIPPRNFPCYLHSTGGTLGEGTACDDDDDGRDLCTSCASSASAASAVKYRGYHISDHLTGGHLINRGFTVESIFWLSQ